MSDSEGVTKMEALENKVDTLTGEFAVFREDENLRWDRHLEAMERNSEQIQQLAEATKGIVEAWTTANAFQRFVKWLSSFSIIGVVIAWIYHNLPGSS